MKRDERIIIRVSGAEKKLWEGWANERDTTVSELGRTAVHAYVFGDVGVPFTATCSRAASHRPGRTCIACGGSARRSA